MSATQTDRILVAWDFSESARRALAWAANQARLTGARIVMVHAWNPVAYTTPDLPASPTLTNEQLDSLEKGMRDAAAQVGATVEVDLAQWPNADGAILDAAARYKATLICMGTHGRGNVARMVLGSVADAVIRHSNVPVLVIRG